MPNTTPQLNLIAHRGNAREYPENTLPALRSAADHGVRHVEFDVHLAADGVPVVIHDDELMRTAGVAGSVFDRPSSVLSAIDVSEPARFGDWHAGIRLPLLSDVVTWLGLRPEITAFVEIKRASLRRFGHTHVVPAILKAIQPVHAQCVVISFDLAAVEQAREAGFKIGWVLSEYDEAARVKFETLAPDFLFCNHEKLPADGGPLPKGPWHWAIYEVDTPDLALKLMNRGVRYIETMAVESMAYALRRYTCASTT